MLRGMYGRGAVEICCIMKRNEDVYLVYGW